MTDISAKRYQKYAEDMVGLTDAEAKWINEHQDTPSAHIFLGCLLIQSNHPDHGGMALLGAALEDVRIEISKPTAASIEPAAEFTKPWWER